MESSLPQAAVDHAQRHECKFARLRKYIRVLRKEFPTALPVTVYRRDCLFMNADTGECSSRVKHAHTPGWSPVYGLAYGPDDYPGRFVIFIAFNSDFGVMVDTLVHEYCHCLTWDTCGRKQHTLEFFKTYGRIYQRLIDT